MSEIKSDAELIAEIRKADAEATAGRWKLWGMDVMADPKGTSDINDCTLVATTHFTDANGHPRTNDAGLIALLRNHAVDLCDRLERAVKTPCQACETSAAFHKVAVEQRDAAWRELEKLEAVKKILQNRDYKTDNPAAVLIWILSVLDERDAEIVKLRAALPPTKPCDSCGAPLGKNHYSAVPLIGDLCMSCWEKVQLKRKG